MKSITVLGSTGSIGKNTLEVVRKLSQHFEIFALAAHSNIELLYQQALEFKPKFIAVYDEEKAKILQSQLPHISIIPGLEGLIEVASHQDVDIVLAAMSGSIGIFPAIEAIKKGKRIALANKEVLVSAGEYVMGLAKQYHAEVLPVDSEHSAIFQCLSDQEKPFLSKIILTASGGPFLYYTPEQLEDITVEKALKHPNWKMGAKITIDSSTLMNKGLEVIEAKWLFDLNLSQIDVVIHPQSIIHSMVEFIDGSILAQMGEPDMKGPIQYALSYPNRLSATAKKMSFASAINLQFLPPDQEKFRCLKLAFESLKLGGSASCFLNAANEVLVSRFLKQEITWKDIGIKLEELLSKYSLQETKCLDDILAVDKEARRLAFLS